MAKVTELVAGLAAPIAEENGCSLWDVEYVREAGQWFLRVYIDKEGGVSIDDCEAVSRKLSDLLDEADPIEQSYYLEVGSPGLGRKLTRPEHYEAVKGQKVSVKLFRANENGTKEFSGILTGREGSTITVETENGTVNFEASAASTVRLCDDEDLFD